MSDLELENEEEVYDGSSLKIFNSDEKVEDNHGVTSFGDCPYHCVNGKIVIPSQHKKVPCPHCEKKRKEVSKGILKDSNNKTIYEALNIPPSFKGTYYNFKDVIPEFASKGLVLESLVNMETVLQTLLADITIGEVPDRSYLFNLGIKANDLEFIYPFLINAYVSALKVAPLVTPLKLCNLRFDYENNNKFFESKPWGSTYTDYIDADVCVVTIDAGVSSSGLDAVKGLMQLRAHSCKPTIIFTNYWGNRVMDLCCDDGIKTYYLASLVSVQYDKKHSQKIEEQTNKVASRPKTMEELSDNSITKEDFVKLTSNVSNRL